MELINFRGKQYPLEFTHTSIMWIEAAYEENFTEVVYNKPNMTQQFILFWSMMLNFEEYTQMPLEPMIKLITLSVEEGEFTTDEFRDKVFKAYADSTIILQIFKTNKKSKEKLPSETALQETFDVRRKGIYGIVRRLRDRCTIFLIKHSKQV